MFPFLFLYLYAAWLHHPYTSVAIHASTTFLIGNIQVFLDLGVHVMFTRRVQLGLVVLNIAEWTVSVCILIQQDPLSC